MKPSTFLETGATFSADRRFRYRLWRTWDLSLPSVLFCMLNGSKASAEESDPTVTRCVGYAQRWGYGRLDVVNAFGLVSTDPRALYTAPDPVGPENDAAIVAAAERADLVIAAWGTHASYMQRGTKVLEQLRSVRDVHALKVTGTGFPAHPLYLKAELAPLLFAQKHSRRVA